MNVSEQLDQFIAENGGNARDALNVALARLTDVEIKLNALRDAVNWTDCPQCGGVIVVGWRCMECNHDPSIDA